MNEFADLDLPEEVLAAINEKPQLNATQRADLTTVLLKLRGEAIAYRKSCGAENVWLYAEEAYLGIDDANRAEWTQAAWAKPMSLEGPVTTGKGRPTDETKSTVFVPITARYVDAGTAKVCEILLPLDDKAFSLEPSPRPDLIEVKDDDRQLTLNNEPLERPAEPGEPASPEGTAPLTVKDLVKEQTDKALDKAKKAETRIQDWMIEGGFRPEMRKVVFDASRIGVGVLKAPFPDEITTFASINNKEGKPEVVQQKKVVPTNKHVDPWNLYPAPGCGERLDKASYVFEVDYISESEVVKLKGQKGYLADAIDTVLELGPNGDEGDETTRNPHKKNTKGQFKVWHFYGAISKDQFASMNMDQFKDYGLKDKDQIHAIVTMINDIPVKATVSTLESGKHPYNAVPWRRRAGFWWGVGVAEQLKTPQRMVNGATRAMLNNAGKSAGSVIVLDKDRVVPADSVWSLTPDKVFYFNNDGVTDDIRKAMQIFQIPNMTPQLMVIVEYAIKLAEESTSIPLITQGQSGGTTPDTFGAAQLQNNNANQLLRSIGYQMDEYITEPVVKQYYEWLLQDPDVPNDEKGDWTIRANGSSALVERALQDQFITQVGPMVLNPAFGVDPAKWFAVAMRSKGLDPRLIQYSEEDMKKMKETPPPPAPIVEVTKMRTESAEKIAQMRAETDKERIESDIDRDVLYQEALNKREMIQDKANAEELELRRELEMYKENNKARIENDKLKAKLAEVTMELQTQKMLAAESNKAAQVATPATEPPGRAPDGEAFQL